MTYACHSYIAGKKKSAAPSDDSKIKLSHPDHVRVLIGDLSDGVAGSDDSDEDISEAEEDEDEDGSEEVCSYKLLSYFKHFSFIKIVEIHLSCSFVEPDSVR